jgi:hypothetical protein
LISGSLDLYDITGLSSTTTAGTLITSSSISMPVSNNVVNNVFQSPTTPYTTGTGRPVAVRITNSGNSGLTLLSVVIGLSAA